MILDFFQEKLMLIFFKKSPKPYFWPIWGYFIPNLGKNQFSWKKWLCQFLNIPIIYHRAKNSQRNNELLLRKMPDHQKYGQTMVILLDPPYDQGPITPPWFSISWKLKKNNNVYWKSVNFTNFPILFSRPLKMAANWKKTPQ